IAGTRQDLPAGGGVVAVQPYHQRLGDLLAPLGQQLQRAHNAGGDLVTRGDPTEDVDEHRLHVRVGQHDLQPVGHHRGARTATDVEEVGRPYPTATLSGVRDDVECGHHQPGAVADHTYRATVELDIVEALLLRPLLQ